MFSHPLHPLHKNQEIVLLPLGCQRLITHVNTKYLLQIWLAIAWWILSGVISKFFMVTALRFTTSLVVTEVEVVSCVSKSCPSGTQTTNYLMREWQIFRLDSLQFFDNKYMYGNQLSVAHTGKRGPSAHTNSCVVLIGSTIPRFLYKCKPQISPNIDQLAVLTSHHG